jgi:hypothetical protein
MRKMASIPVMALRDHFKLKARPTENATAIIAVLSMKRGMYHDLNEGRLSEPP